MCCSTLITLIIIIRAFWKNAKICDLDLEMEKCVNSTRFIKQLPIISFVLFLEQLRYECTVNQLALIYCQA